MLFAWSFLSKVWRGFWARPVYVYMWAVGILYFLWTFAEGHAWLLPAVKRNPVADLQIQWKSCGTLVASFNQMVYGTLIYLGVKQSGDERIGQSGTGFALFGIGLLNSFTNYAHHTYHLPQSHVIKWVAFGASMLEIILLVGVIREVAAALSKRRPAHDRGPGVVERFVGLSKRWNSFLLALAIAISVPPWNALIHGTHVVMAHAMGSEIAIDTYILLGFFAFALAGMFPKREVREQRIDGAVVRSQPGRAQLVPRGALQPPLDQWPRDGGPALPGPAAPRGARPDARRAGGPGLGARLPPPAAPLELAPAVPPPALPSGLGARERGSGDSQPGGHPRLTGTRYGPWWP